MADEDRGDNIDPAVAALAVEDAAAAATAAAATAAETEAAAQKLIDDAAAVKTGAEAKSGEQDPPRDDKTGKFIPVDRHKTILENERAARETAERKLQELQASLKQVDVNADVAALEAEIETLELARDAALVDGDKEKAALLAKDIRHKERSINAVTQTYQTTQAEANAVERVRFDLVVDRLEAIYPTLAESNEAFDQAAVDDILGWQQVYITRDRLSPSAAMLRAAEKVMGAPKAAEAEAAPAAKGLAKGAEHTRATDQVAKNVAAANQQPANMKDVGLDSDKAGMSKGPEGGKLTYDELEAMPDATKARLRGDML